MKKTFIAALFSLILILAVSSPVQAIHTSVTDGADGDKKIPLGLIVILVAVITIAVVLVVRRRKK